MIAGLCLFLTLAGPGSQAPLRALQAAHISFPYDELVKQERERAEHRKGGGAGGPEADNPWEAARWLRKTLLNDQGIIPRDGFKKAMRQRQMSLLFHSLQPRNIAPGMQPTSAPWVSRGPSNVGGRTRSIVTLPGGATLVAGSVSGGIWRSIDGGTTWVPVGDHLQSLAVDCIEQDPAAPNHLLAGTGEAYFNIDADNGAGIFQSSDGGQTWAQMVATANFGNVSKIAFNPANSNLILCGTVYDGIWRTSDGGSTWSNVYNDQGCMDVKWSSTNTSRAVADDFGYDTNTQQFFHRALYSSDGGLTWTPCAGIPTFEDFYSRMSFAFSRRSGSTICYCFAGNQGVWKSTDSGVTFSQVNAGSGLDLNQAWYDNSVEIDPTNDSTVFVTDILTHKSTNGGSSFSAIGDGYNGHGVQPHPDDHFGIPDYGFDGLTDKRFYFTTDGGIYKTDNIYTVQAYPTGSNPSGWVNLNGGYVTTQFYSAEGDASGIYVGGTQDNGTEMTTNASTLVNYIFGGDGGFTAIDHTNPQNIYGEYVDLYVFAYHNGTSNYIYNGIGDSGGNANFIAPLILDPNNANTLLAGGASLWRTTNASAPAFNPTWTSIRSPGSDLISTIAVAQGHSNVIWVGQNNGGLSHTSNGTAASPTWSDLFVNPGSGNVTRYVQNVAIDPTNSNHVYVSFGGYQSNPVYVSTDGGATWTSASGSGATGLPPAPVRFLSMHPNNQNWLFAGTAVGLYESIDGGNTWSTTSEGPANVDVWDTRFIPGTSTLCLGTHGRGMWTQNEVAVKNVMLSSNSVIAGNSVTGTVNLYGQSDASGLTVYLSATNGATVPPTVSLTNGQSSANFTVGTSASSTGTVTITASIYGTSASAVLTLIPPNLTLSSYTVSPTAVVGGTSTSGTVTLSGNATGSGSVVTLSGGDSSVGYPPTVTVPNGSNTISFTITSSAVAAVDTENLTATLGSSTQNATLTVNPTPISTFSITPTSEIGGHHATGTVTLASNAVGSGDVVSLSGGDSLISYPGTVTVLPGTNTASFSISDSFVSSNDVETLTATLGPSAKSATITLTPYALASLVFSPNPQIGGYSAVGTLKLKGKAGPTPEVINLSGGDSFVSYPATVSVPAGATGVKFKILTFPVSSPDTETITATFGSSTTMGTIVVTTAHVSSLTFSPTSQTGGYSATGIVSLLGKAGPSGDVVTLSGGDSFVSYSPTVTVLAGQTGVKFKILTSPVSSSDPEVLTATLGSSSASGTFTVTPATVTSLTFNPSTVTGGSPSTGTITLHGRAGPSGDIVSLSGGDASVSYPASVMVPSGATTKSFTISTSAVTVVTNETITATLGSSSAPGTLTLNPPGAFIVLHLLSTSGAVVSSAPPSESNAEELLWAEARRFYPETNQRPC